MRGFEMKKTLMISMILSIIVLFLASCVSSHSSHNDSAFKLVRQAGGFDLYVSRGIDALEITLSGAHIYAENIVPLQDVLVITRQDTSGTTIALSKFRDLDFAEPVLAIPFENPGSITVSSYDTVILPIKKASFLTQNSVAPDLIGDYNGDGYITLSDFAAFAPAYGFSAGSAEYDEKYDIGASEKQYLGIWQKIFSFSGLPDGSITLAAFAVFANNYGFANPYLGKWTFTGSIDYESGTYGNVKADGNGTLTIGQQNWQMSGPVELTANSTYTDEEGKEVSDTFEIEIASVDLQFSSTEMTVTGIIANPLNGVEYDVLMKGKLRVEGNAIYAESNGTGDGYGIFLLNPTRKIGEWTAHK